MQLAESDIEESPGCQLGSFPRVQIFGAKVMS